MKNIPENEVSKLRKSILQIANYYDNPLKAEDELIINFMNHHPLIWDQGNFREEFLNREHEEEIARKKSQSPKPSLDTLRGKFT